MKSERDLKREYYDRFYRDPETKKFYQSAQWRKVKEMKLAMSPCCQACEQAEVTVKADVVHHIFKITTPYGWEHRLDMTFLLSVCHPCHNGIESEIEKEGNR